jgi:hypothetical protein
VLADGMVRRTGALGRLGAALAAPALALLAPALASGQDAVAGPLAPAVQRGGGASAEPPSAAAVPPPDADPSGAAPSGPALEPSAAEALAAPRRGRRRWGAFFAAGYTAMFVRDAFAAEHRLSARADGVVLEGGFSLRELATLRLAFGAAGQTDASPRVQLTGGELAQVVSISFAKLAVGLRTPFTTFRGAHGLGAVVGASGGYTLTRVTRGYTGCTTDCPQITTVPLGGGAFVAPELLLGYGEDRGVHVGLGVAYDRYLFASRLVDTVEVRLGGGW